MSQNHKSVVIFSGLFVFGVVYNALVGWLERRRYERGYVSFLVVVGTAATLAGAEKFVGRKAALQVAGCFVASGLPMIVGSVWRHVREREADQHLAGNQVEEILKNATQRTTKSDGVRYVPRNLARFAKQ